MAKQVKRLKHLRAARSRKPTLVGAISLTPACYIAHATTYRQAYLYAFHAVFVQR